MIDARNGEFGGARLKFLVTMVIIAAVAYAGYLYVPVAYEAYTLKDYMQHTVDVAVATGSPPNTVADQLVKAGKEYGVPPNAVITPAQRDNRLEVRVQFTKPIEFPGYTYEYEFDHTAKSTAFFATK
jgi:hypothetical protein